jgi:N-acetylated-alpha-linked acidic dipeptidase
VPSTDIGSSGPYGVYHSVFDNYNWFIKNADPTFVYEQQQARVFGIEVLHMADTDVLPYDYVTYGKEIGEYLEAAKKKASDAAVSGVDFAQALAAAKRFTTAAEAVHQKQQSLPSNPAELNAQLRQVEGDLLSSAGLPNRPWFKHTVYAPGEYTGYAAVVIPGVNEALDAKDSARTASQLATLTDAINRAASTLEAAAK